MVILQIEHPVPDFNGWKKAFDSSTHYWPIVLQHLLMGMNAHINLDLGIAAAEISKNKDINDAIKKFDDELKTIENTIHQTKNSSVQDPLNYGIKLNNRLAHLMTEQAQGDYRPTQQGEDVRAKISQMVDEELGKLKNCIDSNLNRINQMAKEIGVLFVN